MKYKSLVLGLTAATIALSSCSADSNIAFTTTSEGCLQTTIENLNIPSYGNAKCLITNLSTVKERGPNSQFIVPKETKTILVGMVLPDGSSKIAKIKISSTQKVQGGYLVDIGVNHAIVVITSNEEIGNEDYEKAIISKYLELASGTEQPQSTPVIDGGEA